MSSNADAVARLIRVCPGFKDRWEAHVVQWERQPAGYYNDLGALAHWVVDRMAVSDLACLPELFREFEAILDGANEDTRDLLVVGFLEDLQNIAANREIEPDLVLPFLGPLSRAGWFELIASWHGPEGSGWPGQKKDRET